MSYVTTEEYNKHPIPSVHPVAAKHAGSERGTAMKAIVFMVAPHTGVRRRLVRKSTSFDRVWLSASSTLVSMSNVEMLTGGSRACGEVSSLSCVHNREQLGFRVDCAGHR